MEKYVECHDYKVNNGRNFKFTNSHLLTFSSPTEEVFQVNGQNQPVANPPVVDFILSREKC